MARPTRNQSQQLERAETRMLRLHLAMGALDAAQIRLGQIRRRVGARCSDLVDFTLGDLSECHSLLLEEWDESTGDREQIIEEVMDNGVT